MALIVLGVIVATAGGGDNKKETTSIAPKNKPVISKAEFDQIQTGMNYGEVKNIIGSDGEIMSESGQDGD